jgi:hypothetical protein
MLPAVIVIDDFLNNAEAVRAEALQLDYGPSGLFPGVNSQRKTVIEGLDQVVSALVHEPLRGRWSDQSSHGSYRLALASDSDPGRIHIDISHWSGILYLSRPEDCRGGTEFYRHLPTGTDRVPTDQAELNALGYASYDEMQRDILEKDALDRSKWELTMSIPMRFNRLVLLQPHYWHTAGPGFGDRPDNGRLIYIMFFERAQAPR